MSKKVSLPKKLKPTKLGDGDNGTKIRETLVGDPSINFTVALDPILKETMHEGLYVIDFKVEVWLKLEAQNVSDYSKVAHVHIKSLSMLDPYFYIPFGDPGYGAGQKFRMRLSLFGRYPKFPHKPIKFNDNGNWFEQLLMGGGILEEGRGGKPKKPKKTKK